MRVKTMLLALICLGFSQLGYAQAQNEKQDQPQDELSSLRTDIRTLQTEQQQIITRLDELKHLLQPNGQPVRPEAPSTLDIRGEMFRGDGGARVAIVEYADFECPYCGDYERRTFPQLLSDYIQAGKVKYVYRDLPLPMHAHALLAARAARCAGEQGKFWEMHDSLFARQNALSTPAVLDRAQTLGLDKEKFTECISSEKYTADFQKSASEAEKMSINGTPTFFLGLVEQDGNISIKKRIEGSAPFEVFKTAIEALLAPNGQEAASSVH